MSIHVSICSVIVIAGGASIVGVLNLPTVNQHVVVACAVSEHRSRAPVESCGVVYCTPQALLLFLESCGSCVTLHKLCHCFPSHRNLCCVSHCVCVLSSLSIVLLCIYTAVDWELSPQSHSLHCRLVASLFCP